MFKAKKNEMAIMDHTGDTKLMWNPDNETEVKVAREMFDSLTKKQYIAYTVKKDGEPGEVIKTFDPKAGKIIMIPPVVGG